MICYHRTTEASAEAILREGWRDATGHYMTSTTLTGVWVSDQPLSINEGAKGSVLLRFDLPVNWRRLKRYEAVERGKPYREWIIPAWVLNERSQGLKVVETP